MKIQKKSERIESHIYEIIGVKQFRALVFKLEKIIHSKDKGKNINYHIKNYNIDELNNFKKFLYYNGFIHVRNSLFLSAVLLIGIVFFNKILLLLFIPSLIKNLYCVMLQRYNYIRINNSINMKKKVIEKKQKKLEENFMNSDSYNKIQEKNIDDYLSNIKQLKNFLKGQEDGYLDDKSLESLYLIKSFINQDVSANTRDIENDDVKTYERRL